MAFFHPTLTDEKWQDYPKATQILNIASELTRARSRLVSRDTVNVRHSLDRSLELIDLTVADNKWSLSSLGELLRLREMLGEFYIDSNKTPAEMTEFLKVLVKFDPVSSQVEV